MNLKTHFKLTNDQLFQSGRTLYPLNKLKFRQINQEFWNKYTDCLKRYYNSFHRLESLIAINGETVNFACKICLSPDEQDRNLIRWKFRAFENNVNQTQHIINSDEFVVVDKTDKSLTLINVQLEHTGEYICELGNMYSEPYYLTVITDQGMRTVNTEFNKNGPHASRDKMLRRFGLQVVTKWKNWSECNVCGSKVGRKFRLGFCTIIISDMNKLNYLSHTMKLNVTDTKILQMFAQPNGIPCKSHILPKGFLKLEDIRNRNDEIMVAFCKQECGTKIVPWSNNGTRSLLKNKNHELMESFMTLKKSELKLPTVRVVNFVAEGGDASFVCPGNKNFRTPIQWKIGNSNYLIPELLKEKSKNRINMSAVGRISIKKIEKLDDNYYSCWQNNHLVGTVKLVVEPPVTYDFEDYIATLAAFLLIFVFLLIFIRSHYNRKLIK